MKSDKTTDCIESNSIKSQIKKNNIVDLTQESSVKIKGDDVDITDIQLPKSKNYMIHYHVDQIQAVRQILEYHFGFNDGIMKTSYTLSNAVTSINHEFLHLDPEKHKVFKIN